MSNSSMIPVIYGEWITTRPDRSFVMYGGERVYVVKRRGYSIMITDRGTAKTHLGDIDDFYGDIEMWHMYRDASNMVRIRGLINKDDQERETVLMYGEYITIPVTITKNLQNGDPVYMIEHDGQTKMVTNTGVAKYYTGRIEEFDPMRWDTYTNVGDKFRLKFVARGGVEAGVESGGGFNWQSAMDGAMQREKQRIGTSERERLIWMERERERERERDSAYAGDESSAPAPAPAPSGNKNDYKQKYLKYKQKYLSLKKL